MAFNAEDYINSVVIDKYRRDGFEMALKWYAVLALMEYKQSEQYQRVLLMNIDSIGSDFEINDFDVDISRIVYTWKEEKKVNCDILVYFSKEALTGKGISLYKRIYDWYRENQKKIVDVLVSDIDIAFEKDIDINLSDIRFDNWRILGYPNLEIKGSSECFKGLNEYTYMDAEEYRKLKLVDSPLLSGFGDSRLILYLKEEILSMEWKNYMYVLNGMALIVDIIRGNNDDFEETVQELLQMIYIKCNTYEIVYDSTLLLYLRPYKDSYVGVGLETTAFVGKLEKYNIYVCFDDVVFNELLDGKGSFWQQMKLQNLKDKDD